MSEKAINYMKRLQDCKSCGGQCTFEEELDELIVKKKSTGTDSEKVVDLLCIYTQSRQECYTVFIPTKWNFPCREIVESFCYKMMKVATPQ